MEVHHHPHVEKKNLKEYFLEFLMIFLAVFLGFIAENIREKLSDRSKGKEYVISLKKDLIADTTAINDFIPALFLRINRLDSLIWMLQQRGPISNGSELYYLARSSTRVRMFEPTNNTITELEHSGDLRLITNRKVINGLIKFEKIIDGYQHSYRLTYMKQPCHILCSETFLTLLYLIRWLKPAVQIFL